MTVDATRPRFAEISTAFPTVPESVAAARRFVAASLRRFDFSEAAVDDAVLATSELVAHAFTTGLPPIRIRVRSVAVGRGLVEVTHGVDGDPMDEDDTPSDDLHLTPAARCVVESVSSRWGSRPSGSGTMSWFEVTDPAATDATGTGPRSVASPT